MDCLFTYSNIDIYSHDHNQCDFELGLQYIENWSKEKPFLIHKENLCHLYELLFKEKGEYRMAERQIRNLGGKVYHCVSPIVVPYNMNIFYKEINNILKDDYDPIYASGLAHVNIGCIHPFNDGNGHIARLVANAILLANNYHYVKISPMADIDYAIAVKDSLPESPSAFIDYWRKKVTENEDKYNV